MLCASAKPFTSACWLTARTPHRARRWRAPPPAQVCWRVACFFPGVTVTAMTFVNIFLWATRSSGAIPLGFFFSIIFLWWGPRREGPACPRSGLCGARGTGPARLMPGWSVPLPAGAAASAPSVRTCVTMPPPPLAGPTRAGCSSPSRCPTLAASSRPSRRSGSTPPAPTRSRATSRRPTGPRTRWCSSSPRACCPSAPSLWSCTLP